MPSITTAWLAVGSSEVSAIVCASKPLMPKTILSGVAPLAVLLAAVIASRSEMRWSPPRLLPRAVIEVVLPSIVSAVVSTTTTPLAVATTFIANSDVAPYTPPPRSTVAVAVTRSPLFTQASVSVAVKATVPSTPDDTVV